MGRLNPVAGKMVLLNSAAKRRGGQQPTEGNGRMRDLASVDCRRASSFFPSAQVERRKCPVPRCFLSPDSARSTPKLQATE
jgi:hypothetical protein